MSAFIVSQEHVDAMVSLALHGPKDSDSRWEGPRWAQGDPRVMPWQEQIWSECGSTTSKSGSIGVVTPDELGELLSAENRSSIDYRYDETNEAEPYVFIPRPRSMRPTVVEGLKLIDCYEYQSCEHPGWRDSEAARFCECLRGSLIGALAGYDAAPWEWSAVHA